MLSLKEASRKLAAEIEGVVTIQRKVVGRVNQIGKKQQEIVEVVNDLVTHQAANERDIWLVTQSNADNRQLIETIGDIKETLDSYQELLSEMQSVSVACEARLVTEQVLPIKFVQHFAVLWGKLQRNFP